MSPIGFLAISLLGLLIAHLAATATKVLQDIYWHELEEYSRRRKRSRFDIIHERADDVTIGAETLLYLALAIHIFFGIAWVTTSHLIGFTDGIDFAIGVAIGTFVLLASLVWLPKAIADYAGAIFLYHTWPVWQAVSTVLAPLAVGSKLVEQIVRRMLAVTEDEDEEEQLEDEIRTIVTEGQYDGLLDSDTRDMIEGVIELDDANVADIMTPRDEMDVMCVTLDWDTILDFITNVGRTRIPVYNGTQDEFLGILYVKDLFVELRQPAKKRRPLGQILRTEWSVPTTMPLDELLQQFKQTRNHLALVRDEYDSIVGLVTIEDVLEEIVGEIMDESDKEPAGEIRMLSEHVAEVAGRVHVQEINESIGCELPEDDEFDTIAGFIMHQLGHIPTRGECVEWMEFQFTVLEASSRRPELVRVAAIDRQAKLLTGESGN